MERKYAWIAWIMLLANYSLYAQRNMPAVLTSEVDYPVASLPADLQGTLVLNSVKTIEPLVPVSTDAELEALSPLNFKVSTLYADGIGRTVQTVITDVTNDHKDLVQHTLYDPFGRASAKLLPFISESGTGSFCKNIHSSLLSTYAALGYTSEKFLYAKTEFEGGPLNTVSKILAEGNSWNGSNKGIVFNKRINTLSDPVRLWNISAVTGLPESADVYPTGSCWIVTRTDEDGMVERKYYDQENKLVLSIQCNNTNASSSLLTYYVYDAFDRLRFVISPKAVKALAAVNWVFTGTLSNNLCYRYEYDEQGRLVSAQAPGGGTAYYVFNKKNEAVFSQTAMQRSEGHWLFNKYDATGRLVQSGIYNSVASRDMLQYHANNSVYPDAFMEYIFNTEVNDQADYVTTFSNAIVYLTNYYDTYAFTAVSFNTTDAAMVEGYNASPVIRADGMLTGVKAMLSDDAVNSANHTYTTTISYYNARNELIQQYKQYSVSHNGITCKGYDFAGRVVSTFSRQNNLQTVSKRYGYDKLNRVLNIQCKINNAAKFTPLVAYIYDKLGRLNVKQLGNMQYPLNYEYNIRGWVTGINKAYCTDKTGNHFFGMEISYNTGYEKSYLNGRVAGIKWRNKGTATQQRSYGYTYDFNQRLLLGDYYQKTEEPGVVNPMWNKLVKDYTASGMDYDENGNITAMKHVGMKGSAIIVLDDLSYEYEPYGNKLVSVTESPSSQSKDRTVHDNLADFRDAIDGIDYVYDANGSLITDGNRGVTINNNWFNINKPLKVLCGGGNIIDFIYDASGSLLMKKVTQVVGGITKITEFDYQEEVTFKNNTLFLIAHEEGRYRPLTSTDATGYEYYIKDHIGNIRSIIGEVPLDPVWSTAPILSNPGPLSPGPGAGKQTGPGNTTGTTYFKSCDTCQLDYPDTLTAAEPTVYLATSELGNSALETQLFDNITETRDAKPMSADVNDVKDAKLNAAQGKVMGPGLLLKVSAGDKIALGAEAFYFGTPAGGMVPPLSTLVNSIISALGGMLGAAEGGLPQGIANLDIAAITANLAQLQNNNEDTLGPRGYLNFIIFDEQMNFLPDISGAIKVTQANAWTDLTVNKFNVPVNGFIYVFTSNLGMVTVRTDNLYIMHWQGQLLEEFHYYPYGLFFEEYRAASILQSSNYKHNSQHTEQNEFNDGKSDYGLDWYDFEARSYDVQIGRFMQIDPLGTKYGNWSPYRYCFDNPVNITDPTGQVEDWYENARAHDVVWVQGNAKTIVKDGLTYENKGASYAWEKTYNGLNYIHLGYATGCETILTPNEYGMVRFPETGPGFARYTGGTVDQYTLNGVYGAHGDNWASPTTAVKFFNTLVNFHDKEPDVTMHYGDISAYRPDINLGHYTHSSGNSIDIRYTDASGNELQGNQGYLHGDVCLINSFMSSAARNGFTLNYSFGNRFTHIGNNNHSVHKNHFHIGR